MNSRIISFIKDALGLLLNYIVNLCIWITFAYAAQTSVPVVKGIMFIAFPIFFYFVRRTVNNIVLFTLIHLATVLGGVWLLGGNGNDSVITALVLVLFALVSFVARLNSAEPGEKPYNPVVAGLIVAAAMFVMFYIDNDAAYVIFARLVVGYISVFFVYRYVDSFMWSDFMNRKTMKNVPTGELFKAGFPYAVGVALLYAVAGVLFLDEKLILKLGEAIRAFIHRLLVFIFSNAGGEENIEQTQEYREPVMGMLESLDRTDMEPAPIWIILEKIVSYMALAIAIAAVIFFVYAVVKAIVNRFHKISNKPVINETDEYVEEKERVNPGRRKNQRISAFTREPALKIRRMYIKLVSKSEVAGEKPQKFTVREFVNLFPEDVRGAALEFAYIYEKARYSPLLVNEDDVKKAKECIKNIEI